MENTTWQKISGTQSCELFSFERKPDVKSSNAYLIRSAEWYAVIDPGADEAQVRRIAEELNPLLERQAKPVLILLTHCHFDHFNSAQSLMDAVPSRCFFCVQERGATALEKGDPKHTLSYLYNQPWKPIHVDMRLLTQADRSGQGTRNVSLDDTGRMELQIGCHSLAGEDGFFYQKTIVNEGEPIIFYHTPGHSPDSLCIQIGKLLWIGDLLLATNPGIAGVVGWSQPDLIRSLENVRGLLLENNIEFCVMGHGKLLPAAKTAEILAKNVSIARRLDDLVLLDRDRARYLDRYAVDLLDEIAELFTIVAGRLIVISYHLETLSEADIAQQIFEKLHIDSIDRFLSEFKRYVETYDNANRMETEIPLQAIQIVSKIQRLFDEKQLHDLIDLSLLRRIRWMMLDFIQIMQGYREEMLGESVEVNALLSDYTAELRSSRVSDRDFFESTGDEETFVRELVCRIALHNVFEKVDFQVPASENLPNAYLERDRFCDTMTALLEPLAVGGIRRITLHPAMRDERIAIVIQPDPAVSIHRYLERKIAFSHRILQMFGGSVQFDPRDESLLIVELQPASECFLVR